MAASHSPPAFVVAPPTVIEEVMAQDVAMCKLASTDANAFMEYVLRDEMTGMPVAQAPIHEAWQYLANDHKRLLIWAHIESGKTSQLSIGRTLFELGRNPNLRICIVSNTHGQASKVLRAVAKYVEQSEDLRRVFPGLIPDEPWTGGQLTVKRAYVSKDPSVQVFGIHGNVVGSRIDLLILDDILDPENTRSPALRDDLWHWYHATLAGRLTANARVLCVGTAYHPDDALHRFSQQPGWHAKRFPVIDPATGQPRWPERWPLSRIEEKRIEFGPGEFARQMLCLARDDADSRFKQEWIDTCLKRGAELELPVTMPERLMGCRVYTGVDLAVQRHSAADYTVLFTIAVHPNGDREVLSISTGRWSGPQIIERIVEAHGRWGSIVIVENNAAQDFILQFTRNSSAVPVLPHTTGRNKANPEFGIESVGTEMKNGKWIIPSKGRLHPEVAQWVQEMLYYDPAAHTGDRLMASWFAREGARKGSRKVQYGRLPLNIR